MKKINYCFFSKKKEKEKREVKSIKLLEKVLGNTIFKVIWVMLSITKILWIMELIINLKLRSV